MTTILVTGGAGFIGANFVHYMAERYPNYRIVVLDQLTYSGSMANLPPEMRLNDHPRFRFWYGNVCNAGLVDALVAESDYVVHFAAETHVTRSIFDNRLFFETDVIGTHTVANAVLKTGGRVRRLIHISTSEVYGTAEQEKMNEDHPLKPMSPYASAKCGADRLIYSYWTTYKLPVTIVRPFNNFGPRQHLEKVTPRFITSAILDEALAVHGDGLASRDFVYVEDVCRALDKLLHVQDGASVHGEVFNVASGVSRSVQSIAQDIARETNPSAEIIYTSDRPGQVTRHTGDYGKLERLVGWKPEVSWEEGVARTIAWYRENRDIWNAQLWMRHIPIIAASGKREYH